MKKLTIIYWSGTGNTETMARLIESGAKESGADVKLLNVCEATEDDVKDAEILALGSPSMGVEVIEECEMEPFVSSIEGIVNGKKIGLFGSYGWGTGEWMENWVERMESCGADVLEEGLIANGLPEGPEADACVEYGKKLVE
ncbi:flavodoxin [Clostridium fallax]|uniref:Flavodoxin n=1 Tax=Clostridium fallax TaxID=1533 RepID=A0A1M4STH3_9CLOT|nr:flavodoxin [Clostridium fallax]SHE35452.1 flavodoxin, short chain [Clostridium fallax]SQB07961.1 flavodoxin [Clostridium fallax]